MGREVPRETGRPRRADRIQPMTFTDRQCLLPHHQLTIMQAHWKVPLSVRYLVIGNFQNIAIFDMPLNNATETFRVARLSRDKR